MSANGTREGRHKGGSVALVIGEALVDEVVTGEQETAYPGGSPFNVAIGLARLDVPTLLHTTVGQDDRGALLRSHADSNNVTLTAESTTSAATSSARAVIGADRAATYDFHISWESRAFSLPVIPQVVHAGSIGAVLPPGGDLVAGVLSALKPVSLISLDPNVRPQLTPDREATRARLRDLVALADVVKVSDEDLAWLYPAAPIDDVASDWLTRGPDLVVVTRGPDGATGYSSRGKHHSVPPETLAADTIGAGDSFMAALLFALLEEGATAAGARLGDLDRVQLERSLQFATTCAAITVSRPGADPPWRSETHPASLRDTT